MLTEIGVEPAVITRVDKSIYACDLAVEVAWDSAKQNRSVHKNMHVPTSKFLVLITPSFIFNNFNVDNNAKKIFPYQ